MANSGVKTSLGNMEDVAKVFNKFDLNSDGKISKTELKAVLEALGSHASPEEVDIMMAEMDKDGDGSIDLVEFAAFHDGSASATEVRDAFEVYDRDGDGLISAHELHAVLKSLGEKCTVKDCMKMIESVDLDGDGFVNFEEFKKMMKT